MKKKSEEKSNSTISGPPKLSLMDKVKAYFNQSPAVIAFKKFRDRLGEKLRQLILAFFALLSPCWTFLFVGTSKPIKDTS